MRKRERKKNRFAARFRDNYGIISTDVAGPNIVMYNVGPATSPLGLDSSMIKKLIEMGNIDVECPTLIVEKGQTYSFLTFTSTEDAKKFYKACHCRVKINKEKRLFMGYVKTVPYVEKICPDKNPEGLLLLDEFITPEEEEKFYKLFDVFEDNSSQLKNRQVKHFGYEFRYESNDVDLSSPLSEKIPDECNILWARLKEYGIEVGKPDQLTVNKYMPRQGIPSHVDKHSPFGGTILSLSLGSSIVMEWKHFSGKYVPVPVEARSMMVMQGEARYDWRHGIPTRGWDPFISTRSSPEGPVTIITNATQARGTRISLTFRWTRSGPCECRYKMLCDSAQSARSIEDDVAANLEELHVHQVYEQICDHFSETRHTPWPMVEAFVLSVPPGSITLDLGAGNGKNVLERNDIFQIAGERSCALLKECARATRGRAACVRLDVLHAPLRDEIADAIICIAVLHHLSSPARRLQAVSTISRLLRPGGRTLITVWAKDQTGSNYLSKKKTEVVEEQIINVAGVSLPIHENRTQFKHNDLLVPWNLMTRVDDKLADQPKHTFLRYYHVFEEDELENLCRQLPLEVEESFYEDGNWCVICRKINNPS